MDESTHGRRAVTTLYRAVSLAEWEHIERTGRLGPSPFSMSGKWFAEEQTHASQWGELLEGPGRYKIVKVDMPAEVADTLFRIAKLDGIGPARYIEPDQLGQLRVIGEVDG